MYFCLLVLLALGICSACSAESWTLESVASQSGTRTITFTFENNELSLNSSDILRGWTFVREYTLLLAGDWAVCGYIDGSGVLHRDPYASFIYNANRDGGHISWTNRPAGYSTNLLLGYSFNGSQPGNYTGYQSYPYNGVITTFPGTPVSGNLVIKDYYYSSPDAATTVDYLPMQHTFSVPEPSTILAVISCLIGIGVLKRRA